MSSEKKYWWKGRIVKKKVYLAMLKRTENGKNRKKSESVENREISEEESESPLIDVKGNRIVNLQHMANQLYCSCCKEPLLIQNIEKEKVEGLASIFSIRCRQCLLMNTVKSGEEYTNPKTGKTLFAVNTKSALGVIHNGTGETSLNKWLSIVDLPTMESKLLKRHERIVGPFIELVAKESCSEATAMERMLTSESIEELKQLLPPELQEGYLVVNADSSTNGELRQKNCRSDYLTRVLEKTSMSWSCNLTKHVQKSEVIALKKKQKSSLPAFKKRRLDLKAVRSQLRNKRENIEGETYKSNMGLLNSTESSCDIDNCIEILTDDIVSYESDDLAVIFFDLETGGLSPADDILQISMKCGNYLFTSFITPVRPINSASTKVTGLSKIHKKLFQYGKEVHTLPRKTVFLKVLDYLKMLKKKCTFVAHNCSFDSLRLVLAIKELSLLEEYKNYIEGFSDSLTLFKKKFPNRDNGYKLTTLATELLCLSCEGAHDAKFDVLLLEKLCIKYLDVHEIITTKKSIENIVENIQKNQKAKELLPSFEPIKSVISTAIQKRLSSCGISYEIIVNTFKTKGVEETKCLLRGEVDQKPTIIKTKKILNSIIDYLNEMP